MVAFLGGQVPWLASRFVLGLESAGLPLFVQSHVDLDVLLEQILISVLRSPNMQPGICSTDAEALFEIYL